MLVSIFRKSSLKLILLLCGLTAIAQADPFTGIVVFGDSLSDNGNAYNASGHTIPPDPPYYMGRRSDGPVAVEQLASLFNVPLADFAFLGATTGVGNYGDGGTATDFGPLFLPGMGTIFVAPGTQAAITPFLSGGLFIVWGGANDFLSPSSLDATPFDTINRAVANELAIVNALRSMGVTHILVPGLPDLGLTPYFLAMGPLAAAQASLISDAFNSALRSSLPAGVTFYDTSALLHSIVANPAAYGLSNTTDPCFNGVTVCADPSKYLFFDDFHPTTATNAFVAQGFASAVPEPSTFVLLSMGLGACLFVRRKRATH